MNVRLYIKRKIAAAHYLPGYPGACSQMHGHTFEAHIKLEGPVDLGTGMVVDFKKIKNIIDRCDHCILNEVLPKGFLPPTAENLALYFLYEIPLCVSVRVWESESCFAEVTARPPEDTVRLGSPTSQKWNPPNWRWLDREYTWLRKSATQIAQEVGTGPKVVIKWLKGVGITPRTISQSQQVRRSREYPHLEGEPSLRTCRRHAEEALQAAGITMDCAVCDIGSEDAWIEVHHVDGDERNNTLENLQWLCRSCHWIVSWQMRREN